MKAVGRLFLCNALACLILVATSAFPAVGAASSEREHPRAQDAIDDWLAAFNAGSLEGLQAFADRYAKQEGSTPKDYLEFRESTGPLNVLETLERAPSQATLLVMGQLSERAMWVTAVMDPANPSHVKQFQIEGTDTPDKYKPERVAVPALMADATAKLEALRAQDALSGALQVARNGKVLLDWRGGEADRTAGIPVGVDTQFRLASSNKMFTAVAILQLMQEGKLSLDDTIGKFLPDYPNRVVANSVTVRHLLSHTSGLGDFFGDDFEQYSASLKTLDDYVQRFARMRRSSRRAARTATQLWLHRIGAHHRSGFGAVVLRLCGRAHPAPGGHDRHRLRAGNSERPAASRRLHEEGWAMGP